MKSRKSIIALILSAFTSGMQGQPLPDSWVDHVSKLQPMEPTTASLGRYGEYPMDHSNGLPDISIPLYEIKSGDLTVPIVLRYQGGGIKVQQEATWVGLGWDLFYGGQITRVVHGFPDEDEPPIAGRPTAASIEADLLGLNEYSILTNSYLAQLAKGNQASLSFMPDEYYYNVGLESGKFMGKDAEALIPYKPVKITGIGDPTFTITNARGEVYHFTKGEITKLTVENYPSYTSAWCINSITSPNNHTVTYEYQTDGYYCPASFPGGGYYEGYYNQYEEDSPPTFMINQPIPLKNISMRPTITSKKPQYIYFNGGRLRFMLSARDDIQNLSIYSPVQKLSTIVVQRLKPDNNYETVKSIYFEYSYSGTSPNSRLMLDRVYEHTNGLIHTIAQFEYDSTLLPAKNSYNYDYCGYYNGSSNTTPIPLFYIPTTTQQITIGGANKNVVESASKAGVLTAVKYPTKGKTVFTWENHRYGADEPLYQNQYTQNKTVSLYNSCPYEHDFSPSPVLDDTCGMTMFHYIDCKTNQTIRIQGGIEWLITADDAHDKYDRGKIKVENLTTGDSIIIASSYISTNATVDKFVDLKAGQSYRISATTTCTNLNVWAYFTYNAYDPSVDQYNYPYGGLRIKEIVNYDSDGELLEKTVYTYLRPDAPNKSSGYITNASSIVTHKMQISLKGYWDDSFAVPKCTNTVTQSYWYYDNPSVGIYPNNLSYQYVQIQKINADSAVNGIVKYEFRQAFDDVINEHFPTMSRSSERGLLLKESICDGSNNLLKETTHFYNYHPSVTASCTGFRLLSGCIRVEPVVCSSGVCFPKTMYLPIEYTYLSTWCKNDSTIILDYLGQQPVENKSLYTYNDVLNALPTQLVSFVDGKQITKNYEYEYQRPVLEEEIIDNQPTIKRMAKYHFVPLSQNPFTPPSLFIDSILVQYRNGSAQTEIRINKRDSVNNIWQYKTKDNIPVTCLWGYKNQYLIAKIENATYSEVTAKISESALEVIANKAEPASIDFTTINNLRTQLPNAMVTTYTYKPLVGLQTLTDPSGKTITYHYDPFGRLQTITDQNGKVIERNDYHYKD